MHPETIDRTYKLLSNACRRQLLYLLLESEQWTVDTLARRLTAWEQETPAPAVTESETKQVKATLVHTHLPRLADHGAIEYDADREAVAPGSRFDEVCSFVDRARAVELGGSTSTQASSGELTS
ncbi:DUF7344 domain-containing protein [Natronolimnobius baerhuensis]|uniref:DUF7344 domain-containing protein n=1 Tax=Natronolimnobius baerhuensis TaxID=253108 RepID=A0A202EAK2_9EURY|nr:hypothetical protein [Natronolimnobius baerhuensis]OVE85198.1 hypothetical protein B2G88_09085 [Natronolimnobius baerhuensis]